MSRLALASSTRSRRQSESAFKAGSSPQRTYRPSGCAKSWPALEAASPKGLFQLLLRFGEGVALHASLEFLERLRGEEGGERSPIRFEPVGRRRIALDEVGRHLLD